MDSPWEHFEHITDIGIRGTGKTREAAFETAALALTAIVTDPANVSAEQRVHLVCKAVDEELLLLEWLNAIIFEMDTRKLLFGRYTVEIEALGNGAFSLAAELWGEPVDVGRHQPAVLPKGATATELLVERRTDARGAVRWVAQCVVDV